MQLPGMYVRAEATPYEGTGCILFMRGLTDACATDMVKFPVVERRGGV